MYKPKQQSRKPGNKRFKPRGGSSRSGFGGNRGGGGGGYRGNRGRGGRGGARRAFKSFDPQLMITNPQQTQKTEEYVAKHKFSDFSIVDKLAGNIAFHKFVTPTPIQDQAIPHILNGKDVVGVANTGTGKTAAFLIPLINRAYLNKNANTLIVAPTRELAVQIDKELYRFTKDLGIRSAVCIGGVSYSGQTRQLRNKPNFIIGTPGRLLDLRDKKLIRFDRFDTIVLDEVDRMLDMGFIHDITTIISELPKHRQSLFFSATLDAKVKAVMHQFITDPVMLTIKNTDVNTNIKQDIIKLNGRPKHDVLIELLRRAEVSKSLIFTRTKRGADSLHKKLTNDGFRTTILHGDRSQHQRRKSLESFTKGHAPIMIATDVASRGIDVKDISHVINHDLPETYDDYVHRIGRTGRADSKGTAITIIEK